MVATSSASSKAPKVPRGPVGGARPGAGRKVGGPKNTKEIQDIHEDFSAARAKKETWLAEQAELNYKVAAGQYVPRTDVQQAAATAFAAIAQTLRSIPDNLERKLGLSPEVAEEVSRLIDDAMEELSADLEKMCEKDYAA